MSPNAATALLSVPPIRGFFAILFLLLVPTCLVAVGEPGRWGMRLGATVVVLLLGSLIWAVTLTGFLRDVGPPPRRDGAVSLAWRPRRGAVMISWIALVIGVLSALTFPTLLAPEPGLPRAVTMLALMALAALGLALASLLPRTSRRYATAAGTVAAGPAGLILTPPHHAEEVTIPYAQLRGLHAEDRVIASLPASVPDSLADSLGRSVRWRPGALDAVQRWADEGFAPTLGEVRTLGLDPAWSPDPDAFLPTRRQRWISLLPLLWADTVLLGLLAALIGGGLTGKLPVWGVLVFGAVCVVGLVSLLPRTVRQARAGGVREESAAARAAHGITGIRVDGL